MNDELRIESTGIDLIAAFTHAIQSRAVELKQQADEAAKAVAIWKQVLDARGQGLWFRLRTLIEEEKSNGILRFESLIILQILEVNLLLSENKSGLFGRFSPAR